MMISASSLRGWPYPDYGKGIWGEPTVTLNFCEEDYALTYYCAELCNTVTNIMFLWLGVRGLINCIRQSHPKIFIVAFLGYLVVGLGSIFFHATLKYPMQLVDELSMIYTTCLMMFASFSFSRSTAFSVLLGTGLLGLSGFITIYYHMTKDPAFHQAAYAALTATVVFRGMWVMESQLRPALESRNPADGKRLVKTMWAMVGTGLSVFLTGYLIWNLDNFFCTEVRRIRRSIGLPWAVVLEGHGWWHLFTGLGGKQSHNLSRLDAIAYYYIVWGIWMRHCLAGRDQEYAVHWPNWITSIPEIQRVDQTDSYKKRA